LYYVKFDQIIKESSEDFNSLAKKKIGRQPQL